MPPAEDRTQGAEGGHAGTRRRPRYRRQLRTRIILAFVLLGFGLTLLLAYTTNWTRNRVENQLVEDVLNSNLDQYAARYAVNPNPSSTNARMMRVRSCRR